MMLGDEREGQQSEVISVQVGAWRSDPIELNWSAWTPWHDLRRSVRDGGVAIGKIAGVYEVRDAEIARPRLAIGRTTNLRRRIRAQLIGSGRHSAGERVRVAERDNLANVVVRWAATDRYALAEAALHEWHVTRFGRLPLYAHRT